MRPQWVDIRFWVHKLGLSAAWLCAVGLSAVCMVACSAGEDDGDEYIPPYITDLLEVATDAYGMLSVVTLDNGATYDVTEQQKVTNYPDTTFRCRAIYTLEKGKLKLSSVVTVFANKPVPASAFSLVKNGVVYSGEEYIPRDPMKVISMWKSGGYINLHLGLMTTGRNVHQYAFCEDAPGKYSLVHLRPWGDAESYTEQVYMSMPIPKGVEELTFSVNTYDGVYTQTF